MTKRYYSFNHWEDGQFNNSHGFQVRPDTFGPMIPEWEYPSAKELILKLIHEYHDYKNLIYSTRINFDFDNVETVMSSIYVHYTINQRLLYQLKDNTYKLFNYEQIVELVNNGNWRASYSNFKFND